MKKLQLLFENIDHFIFKKIDLLKSTTQFTLFSDKIAKLDTNVQKYLNQFIAIMIATAPALLTFVILIYTLNLKNNVEVQQEILNTINTMTNTKNELSLLETKHFSPSKIESQGALSSKITSLLPMKGIDIKNVSIANFNSKTLTANLNKIDAEIHFKDFTTQNLADLLTLLLDKEKMKTSSLSINKNPKNNMVDGTLFIEHYSKN